MTIEGGPSDSPRLSVVGDGLRRLESLADAARAIAGASTVEDLLRVLAESARSIIGTHQAVTSRRTDGWPDSATYVSLSDKYAEFRDYDVVPEAHGVFNAVTRENRSLRLTPEQLAAHPEWRGLKDSPGHPPLPDYLAAPLISRDGRNIGLIQLSEKLDGTPFTAEDEATAVQLALMASASIEHVEVAARYAVTAEENSHLIATMRYELAERERITEALQRPLQPPVLPTVPGVELGADYRPFGGGLDVGGDFYDVFETSDGRWVVVVGDVCGKGPEAAALVGLARATLPAAAEHAHAPEQILRVLHRALERAGGERYCTAVLATLEPRRDGVRVRLSRAGHPLPLIVPAAGPSRPLAVDGMPLGLLPDVEVGTVEMTLCPGETLLLYTDGLVDGGGRSSVDDEELRRIVDEGPRDNAQALVVALMAEVSSRGPARDDSAVLAVRALPASGITQQ